MTKISISVNKINRKYGGNVVLAFSDYVENPTGICGPEYVDDMNCVAYWIWCG